MKTSLLATCSLVAFSASASLASAAVVPVAVTGFTQDVIAEAGAPTTAGAVTAPFEFFGAPFTLYEKGHLGNAIGGLPSTTLVSQSDPTQTFQLRPFTGSNSLQLHRDVTSGTLTLSTPQAYTALRVLAGTTWGPATVNYSLTYASGSNDTGSISVPDWFGGASPVISGLGRVLTTGGFDNSNPNDPRLYSIGIPVDSSRNLLSIGLTYANTNNTNAAINIFAVSGTVVPEPTTAVALLGLAGLMLNRRTQLTA
jgi:hypothetical protein